MNRQFALQEFKQELELFLANNSQELFGILQLIPDFNLKSYPIYLGQEMMEIVGDLLETYTLSGLDSETKNTEKVVPQLFPTPNDRSLAEKIDNRSKSPENAEHLWQYQQIFNCQPANHSESYCQKILVEDGCQIIGASVRGKSHKHKGTNRDDWLEFTSTDNWQIIALADGAGSKMFSRLGAKISCQTALESLAQNLAKHKLESRSDRNSLKSSDRDIALVYQFIAEAVSAAYKAVVVKAEELEDSVTYFKVLGDRRLELSDLAATLLITVRTTIIIDDREYSFVFSHQIGDGTIAAISEQNSLHLLGEPDIGDYAGQTSFLTSSDRSNPNFVRGNVRTFLGKLKTLMVMSDGVSDDYFPNSTKIGNLYGDLVLNQILPLTDTQRQASHITLEQSTDILQNYADFCCQHQVLTAEGAKDFPVAYLDKYAQFLGMSEVELIASPLLAMGAKANPVGEIYRSPENACPAARLRNWLDAYYRRGSFDDRTLVVLYQ